MAKHIGLEWAGKGWFGVVLHDDGGWETDLFPSVFSLWKYHSDATNVFIDVPIGLPGGERRRCDRKAKRRLGNHHGGVFYAPVREAVYEGNLEDAKEINERAGYSIQNQAWSLVPRIREVDEFLDTYPSARDRLTETHPELCFYALNGRNGLDAGKTTETGQKQRRALLTEEHADAGAIYEESVARFTEPAYAPLVGDADDVLGALVAAVTARRAPDGVSTLPEGSPTDERGLPMQITYPSDVEQTRLTSL
jgi:predicted RNase H-like nuclease